MKVEIYGKENCSYCTQAKHYLSGKGISYIYHDVMVEGVKDALVARLPEGFALKQVPQIFADDKHVGGYLDMLHWLLERSQLKPE